MYTPFGIGRDDGIRKAVPARALSLTGLHAAESITSAHILSVSNCLQVIGINTPSNPAKMIEFESSRDGSAVNLVTEAMGQQNASQGSQLAVSRCGNSSRPQPTGIGLFDTCPKTDHGINWERPGPHSDRHPVIIAHGDYT